MITALLLTLGGCFGLVLIVALICVGIYNGLVALRNRYKNAFAQIDVQLKRRYDLIPNLIETAKGYMKHERETLDAVIQARNHAFNAEAKAVANPGDPAAMKGLSSAEGQLSGAMGRLFALAESYPDLKANQNMLALQEELTSTENKVAFSRQGYNDAVTTYNTKREQFPGVLLAGMFGFGAAELFEIENEKERAAPQVKFQPLLDTTPSGGLVAARFTDDPSLTRKSRREPLVRCCFYVTGKTLPMDFFGSQEAARRKTKTLVAYFVIAVASMIAILYTVAVATLGFAETQQHAASGNLRLWRPEILLVVTGGTIGIISIGSLYKTMQLRGGGASVAEQLGGRRLQANSRDVLERRLLNVVEEMALAAGTTVPPVYLLDKEPGINAFAAGFTPGDAVIGVNRGTIEHLSRDELQGVIAHEFSHILNGDMRLNLRLMGLLHGILLIAIIGYYIIRSGGGGSSRSSSDRGKGGGQILLIGLAMLIVGYAGLFFARLIKAAVSRQREYLADASAVQFTRNPDGIAGALKKIGALSVGSRMETAAAETASHMFFGNFRNSLFQALATHPPLVERIQRVDPHFDGNFAAVVAKTSSTPSKKKQADPRTALEGLTRPLGGLAAAGMGGNRIPIDPVIVMAAVGEPTRQHVDHIHDLLDRLPDPLRNALRDPFSCRAVVAALLLDQDPDVRSRQLHSVHTRLGELPHQETNRLAPLVEAQGAAARLPLVEIAANTLQSLSPSQYQAFRETVIELVKADVKIDLFEFTLQRVLIRRLDQHFYGRQPPQVRYPAIGGVTNEVSNLISALSHLGHPGSDEAKAAFERTSAAFAPEKMLVFRPRGECSLTLIDEALDKLEQGSAAVKKRVLNAATVSVVADGVVTIAEGELLRAIADSLDCPMPPLLGAEAASV